MQYRYAQNRNFEDYASGRVFYNQPGQAAFPVRLASETFQRALAHWRAAGGRERCTIYDPVCGGAYWLAVLAYLHWDQIGAVIASDIQAEVLPLAGRNLSLLTAGGLDRRIAEIESMLEDHHKESHASALTSAKKLRQQLDANLKTGAINTKIFQADAANLQNMAGGLDRRRIDLVLADMPYGWHSHWRGANGELSKEQTPVWGMLEALYHLLEPGALLAVALDKSQKAKHPKYHRLERFQLGKRRIFILQPQ